MDGTGIGSPAPSAAVAAFSLIYENEPKIKKLNWFCVLLTFVCQAAVLLPIWLFALCFNLSTLLLLCLCMRGYVYKCVYIIENTRTQIRTIRRERVWGWGEINMGPVKYKVKFIPVRLKPKYVLCRRHTSLTRRKTPRKSPRHPDMWGKLCR